MLTEQNVSIWLCPGFAHCSILCQKFNSLAFSARLKRKEGSNLPQRCTWFSNSALPPFHRRRMPMPTSIVPTGHVLQSGLLSVASTLGLNRCGARLGRHPSTPKSWRKFSTTQNLRVFGKALTVLGGGEIGRSERISVAVLELPVRGKRNQVPCLL